MAAESATSSVATGSCLDPAAGLMGTSHGSSSGGSGVVVVPAGNGKRLQFEDYLIKVYI